MIINYVKTNIDLMENFPINNHTDSKLIELLCRTLGFENKTDYRVDDLNVICSIFIDLIKNKGTKAAIEKLAKTILNIENITVIAAISKISLFFIFFTLFVKNCFIYIIASVGGFVNTAQKTASFLRFVMI